MALPFQQFKTGWDVLDENDVLVFKKDVDISLAQGHGKEMIVTEHPVSRGIPVSDNIKAKPQQFTMVALFTDFPASPDAIIKKLAAQESAKETYEQLLEIMDLQADGWRFRVKTSLRTYENMVLQKMDAPRTVEKSNHVEITMVFKEIRKASSKQEATPKRKAKQPKKDKGPQPKAKPKPEQAKTVFKKGVDFAKEKLSQFLGKH